LSDIASNFHLYHLTLFSYWPIWVHNPFKLLLWKKLNLFAVSGLCMPLCFLFWFFITYICSMSYLGLKNKTLFCFIGSEGRRSKRVT
jgi:hypothetical protein